MPSTGDCLYLWSLLIVGRAVLQLLIRKKFVRMKVTMIFIANILTPKSIFRSNRVGLIVLLILIGNQFSIEGQWPWPATYWPSKQWGSSADNKQSPYQVEWWQLKLFFSLLIRNQFPIQGHCDLELRPFDTQNDRGHLLPYTNPNFKLGDCWKNNSSENFIDRKQNFCGQSKCTMDNLRNY